MPTKKEQNEAKRKQEIAAKVQEIKARQQKWLDERNSASAESTPTHQYKMKNTSSYGMTTPKQETTTVNNYSSHTYAPSNYQTPRSSSPEDFNKMADQIIQNAKTKIGMSESAIGSACNTEVISDPLTAHLCTSCNNLMIAPDHSPMMLVPCGHSLCSRCSDDIEFCCTCAAEVSSSTVNVMLQQIIASKHKRQRKSYQPHEDTSLQKSKDKEQTTQNLLLRKEALNEELNDITSSIKGIHKQIQEENHQISNIESKEADIVKQISSLQKRMMTLQEHKQEFKDKIFKHEDRIRSEQKKTTLIKETLAYLDTRLSSLGHT